MITINEAWEIYAKHVFKNIDPPKLQYKETKKAFYAGVYQMLQINLKLGDSDISEEKGAQYLENMLQECEQFFDKLLKEQIERN